MRRLILQLIFIQSIIEVLRVLAVFDCSYDPQSVRATALDALVVISLLFSIWAISVTVRLDPKRTGRFNCIKKFLVFKVMIGVSKFLGKLLDLLAKVGIITKFGELGARQRSAGISMLS